MKKLIVVAGLIVGLVSMTGCSFDRAQLVDGKIVEVETPTLQLD